MDCRAASDLVHRYNDGEVGHATAAEIDSHVETCAACRQLYGRHRALQRMVRHSATRYTAPPDLAERIGAALHTAPAAAPAPPSRWRAAALAASILLSAGLSSGITWMVMSSRPPPGLTQELVASHVRSLMADHLTDVASSDQHTVKPWFNGRIDVSPPVRDLAAEGFPLVGGRLDYIGGRPAAALVYRRNQHVINLFAWPAGPEAADGEAAIERQGYNLRHWREGGAEFWIVSDLNPGELDTFERLIRAP